MNVDKPKKVASGARSRTIEVYCDSGHEPVVLGRAESQAAVWERWALRGPHVNHEVLAYTPESLKEVQERSLPIAFYRLDGKAIERYTVRCPGCSANAEFNDIWFGTHHWRTFGRLSALADVLEANGESRVDLSRFGSVLSYSAP